MTPRASLAALHAAVALFGFAGLFGKWLAWDPMAIVFGRTVVAAGILTLLVLWRRAERGRPSPALAGNGLILAVHWVAFFAAIQVSTVAVGLLGFASFPLFVIVLERWLQGRRWKSPEVTTAVLVVAGLSMLIPSFTLADRTVQGLAWGVLSGFTFAWLTVRNRALGAGHRPLAVALWQNAFAALCLAPLVFRPSGPAIEITAATLGLACCWVRSAPRSPTRCSSQACRASPRTRRAWSRDWNRFTASRLRRCCCARSPTRGLASARHCSWVPR